MKKKYIVYLLFISMILVLMLGMSTYPYKTQGHIPATGKKDELYKKIQTYHDEYKMEPIDAKVDRVWKAIPGYNQMVSLTKTSLFIRKHLQKFIYKICLPNRFTEEIQKSL